MRSFCTVLCAKFTAFSKFQLCRISDKWILKCFLKHNIHKESGDESKHEIEWSITGCFMDSFMFNHLLRPFTMPLQHCSFIYFLHSPRMMMDCLWHFAPVQFDDAFKIHTLTTVVYVLEIHTCRTGEWNAWASFEKWSVMTKTSPAVCPEIIGNTIGV